MVEISLTLNKDALKNTEKLAIEESKKVYGESDESYKSELYYPDLRFEIEEMYYDNEEEKLVLNGNIYCGKEHLGNLYSNDLPIDLDLVVDLVQVYMKKLGKLKTVLEATK